MESYKAIFLIGVFTISSFSNVLTTTLSPAPEPSISTVPVSAQPSRTSAPGPIQNDIDIDFTSVVNVADLSPKLDNINKFDFTSLKLDTTAKDLCKETDFNNECLAAILPDIQKQEGKSMIQPKDVMRLQTESLFKKANATLEYAKGVVDDSKTEDEVKEAMSVCVENYESLLSSLEEAKVAIDDGDYGRLKSVLSGAISDVSTCSDAFVDISHGVDSPTKSLDDLMKKLCSNILAMSQKLQQN